MATPTRAAPTGTTNPSASGALLSVGIASDKITTGAFGETQLKCSEATEECWQRDRRVEVLVRRGE
jgi:outer membrane protein OmpA-like peptidoglycan-associated protein